MSGLRPSCPQVSSFHSSLLRRLRLRSAAERGSSQDMLVRTPDLRLDERHLVAILRAVLQVVDARQLVDHEPEGRVDGDVVDPLTVDPDLAAVPQAFDVAPAGHRPQSWGGFSFKRSGWTQRLPPRLIQGGKQACPPGTLT